MIFSFRLSVYFQFNQYTNFMGICKTVMMWMKLGWVGIDQYICVVFEFPMLEMSAWKMFLLWCLYACYKQVSKFVATLDAEFRFYSQLSRCVLAHSAIFLQFFVKFLKNYQNEIVEQMITEVVNGWILFYSVIKSG